MNYTRLLVLSAIFSTMVFIACDDGNSASQVDDFSPSQETVEAGRTCVLLPACDAMVLQNINTWHFVRKDAFGKDVEYTYKADGRDLILTIKNGDGSVNSKTYFMYNMESDAGVEMAYSAAKATCKDGGGNDRTTKVCSSVSSSIPYVSLTDDRDGKTYKIVEIGSQWWMAENLTYGRDDGFYGWSSALNSCPSGWHLPSVREFETLVDAVGGGSNVDSVLELAKNLNDSTSLAFFWSSDSCEVTAYDRRYPIPSEEFAYSMELNYYSKSVYIGRWLKYQSAFVRCVKDDE
ncbi:FISUMP domain-containing protein [Fibrobacter sp. UWB4]|uniref:FISUMP domain-containing protein n=1 Tax=Fibrobacter sp. UWB4 TaxID=1964356 RepID=UPI0020CFBFA4|nr:FISUMP domain-containing protein [Fibrobacter sp. UWB4]